MQTQQGTVVSIDALSVVVAADPTAACQRCLAGKGCGAGLFAQTGRIRKISMPRPSSVQLEVGDRVTLSLQAANLAKASFLAYGVPMLTVLLALATLEALSGGANDGIALGVAVVAFAGSHLFARAWLARERCERRLTPVISSVVKRSVVD